MKITIVGAGYVGLSLAVLISQKYDVCALDILDSRVDLINRKLSPIDDEEIKNFLANKNLKLKATLNKKEAYTNSQYIIIATPTNYDVKSGSFDTTSVQEAIRDSNKFNANATIVIKSTIPFGFIDQMRNKFDGIDIFFSPEFLREGKALYDNLNPSRIVIGDYSQKAIAFGNILVDCSHQKKQKPEIFFMDSKEAEAVKLFSNTYLAMRISFFNELDTFAEVNTLSSRNLINAICADDRIGNYYNNPSFGYGGYCLPKDTKQLLDNFGNIPNKIIKAVIDSNETRKKFIFNTIINKKPRSIGIYRLIMKIGSDNFRESAILDIIKLISTTGINVYLYEPSLKELKIDSVVVINNFQNFIEKSDLILANRLSLEIQNYKNKIYTRDLFQEN